MTAQPTGLLSGRPRQHGPLAAAVADLHGADLLLTNAASALHGAERPILATAATELAALIAGWAAVLQASHDRACAAPYVRPEPER